MYDFIEFLEKYKIIPNLKKKYLENYKFDDEVEILDNLYHLLSNFNSKEPNTLDLFASIYHNNVSVTSRKNLGEFYTPIKIVIRILDGIGYKLNDDITEKTIIDISCGSGSFLIQCIKRLITFELNKHKIENVRDLTINDAKNLINKIYSLIYGVDINPIACIMCQINILFTLFDLISVIISNRPNYKIPIFQILNRDTLKISYEQKYDYVVGNPPYLFVRDISMNQRIEIMQGNFETNKGQYDYYQLFIEIGINLLKLGGFLGYIIPDSLLVLSNRKKLRKFIYDTTLIKEISSVGTQFEDPTVANVIIILQKDDNYKDKMDNIVKMTIESGTTLITNEMPQNMLEKWNYYFLIHLNQQDIKIIEYLKNSFPNLENLSQDSQYKVLISRGVELTKNGEIIYCNSCEKYSPLPKKILVCKSCGSSLNDRSIERIIVNHIPNDSSQQYSPFLYSIKRYKSNKRKFIILNKQGINYKNKEIYEDRIVIRQLNEHNLICAAYDEMSYTSQSLYNLKIIKTPVNEFNNYYLLGLLNSELLSYFFIKLFGSYKSLFPRILIEKIKSLPIKIPKTEIEKQQSITLQNEVISILNSQQNEQEVSSDCQAKINTLVYTLYQINKSTSQYISSFLNNL